MGREPGVRGGCGKAPEKASEKPGDITAGLTRQDGLLPTYVDRDKGRILVALPKADADGVSGRFLYVTALKTGLGSALCGLPTAPAPAAAGSWSSAASAVKVIAEYENPDSVAADLSSAEEQAAARDAFAVSTVWAGKVEGLHRRRPRAGGPLHVS